MGSSMKVVPILKINRGSWFRNIGPPEKIMRYKVADGERDHSLS